MRRPAAPPVVLRRGCCGRAVGLFGSYSSRGNLFDIVCMGIVIPSLDNSHNTYLTRHFVASRIFKRTPDSSTALVQASSTFRPMCPAGLDLGCRVSDARHMQYPCSVTSYAELKRVLVFGAFSAKMTYPDISNYRARPSRFCAIHFGNAVIEGATQTNQHLK